jgi:hypothetical protein
MPATRTSKITGQYDVTSHLPVGLRMAPSICLYLRGKAFVFKALERCRELVHVFTFTCGQVCSFLLPTLHRPREGNGPPPPPENRVVPELQTFNSPPWRARTHTHTRARCSKHEVRSTLRTYQCRVSVWKNNTQRTHEAIKTKYYFPRLLPSPSSNYLSLTKRSQTTTVIMIILSIY